MSAIVREPTNQPAVQRNGLPDLPVADGDDDERALTPIPSLEGKLGCTGYFRKLFASAVDKLFICFIIKNITDLTESILI